MLAFTRKPNSASHAFLTAGALWFLIGTLYGMTSAIHMVAPEFFNNIPALVFGRTRPAHVNTMVFGFVTSMLLGFSLYAVPALLKTRALVRAAGLAEFCLLERRGARRRADLSLRPQPGPRVRRVHLPAQVPDRLFGADAAAQHDHDRHTSA